MSGSGQKEKYKPPTEFKAGGDPPGGAVRRQRGRGGIPPEITMREPPRNVGNITHETPTPTYSPAPANLAALLEGARSASREVPNYAISLPSVRPVDPQAPPPLPNYGDRFHGVTDRAARIKIWREILDEESESKKN